MTTIAAAIKERLGTKSESEFMGGARSAARRRHRSVTARDRAGHPHKDSGRRRAPLVRVSLLASADGACGGLPGSTETGLLHARQCRLPWPPVCEQAGVRHHADGKDGLGPGADVQGSQHGGNVVLDGLDREVERTGDQLVGRPRRRSVSTGSGAPSGQGGDHSSVWSTVAAGTLAIGKALHDRPAPDSTCLLDRNRMIDAGR